VRLREVLHVLGVLDDSHASGAAVAALFNARGAALAAGLKLSTWSRRYGKMLHLQTPGLG